MSWTHRTIIVPVAHAELARSLCAALAGPAGAGMFTTALSPTGALPVTHYISTGAIDAEFAALLPPPARTAEIVALAAEAGLTVEAAEVTALLNAADVSGGDPWAAMARLGLALIQEPAANA